jgi:hypothetical protein
VYGGDVNLFDANFRIYVGSKASYRYISCRQRMTRKKHGEIWYVHRPLFYLRIPFVLSILFPLHFATPCIHFSPRFSPWLLCLPLIHTFQSNHGFDRTLILVSTRREDEAESAHTPLIVSCTSGYRVIIHLRTNTERLPPRTIPKNTDLEYTTTEQT